ncbi:MAG: site-specific integrase [Alphaproteobacteria bacterium]
MQLYKRKGSTKWWVQYYDTDGIRRRRSTGTDDKKLAQALAAKWEKDRFLEDHFGAVPDTPFREALLRYAQERKRANLNGYETNVKYRLQLLLDRFDGMNVAEISHREVLRFSEDRLATVKPGTAQRDLATLRAILNKACREGYLVSLPTFPKTKKVKTRCRWLTSDEEHRLMQAAPSRLRQIIAFAVDTGGRRSELLGLDWRNVDMDQSRITFVDTKNGEDRSIRLTARARQVLLELGPQLSGPVFTWKGKVMHDCRSSFDRARSAAGLKDFRFHDLRHTFASRLVQNGVSIYEVMHLTGHKSLAMVQRYAHLAPDFQKSAIAALDRHNASAGTVWAQSEEADSIENTLRY